MLLDINGFRILTDPTLDAPGHLYHHGSGAFSRKTSQPALPKEALADVDLILLSHHQHKDNFDKSGKAFALNGRRILSTVSAARVYDGIIGLHKWETHELSTEKVPGLRITATPAQHRPFWVPEFVSGKVIGFLIEFYAQQNGAIYIGGDTVFFPGLVQVGQRYKIDIAIFNLGSVQFRYLTGFGRYTMDARQLLKAARAVDPRIIIPVHYSGWTHFKEKKSTLQDVIAKDEFVRERTLFLTPGKPELL